jgi:hypothetical protein
MAAPKKKRRTTKRDSPNGRPAAKRRDPLAGVKPIDLDRFIGALPDDRSAEEILADLYAMKYGPRRRWP